MKELLNTLSLLGSATEFWSAIAGAVVGGLIAFIIQIATFRASKKQRYEDRLFAREALANSLLFKVVRIHSNLYGILHHIESCYEMGREQDGENEPWRFLMPLANPPETISFSADEMGMLLALKDNEVFNSILSMDTSHNSLVELIKLIATTRRELTDRLKVGRADGTVLTGFLTEDEHRVLRPRMIEVNSLIENARIQARNGYRQSVPALDGLAVLLRKKLHLTYSIQRIKEM